MKRIFADTSYWIALLNPRDELHARAVAAAPTSRGSFGLEGLHQSPGKKPRTCCPRYLEGRFLWWILEETTK
jgi:hypothetical protein